LRKRKEPKAKKSMVEALMRDVQGTAAEKLALFEKLKAGRSANACAAELRKIETILRTFVAMKGSE
jgi:hypothetical protein